MDTPAASPALSDARTTSYADLVRTAVRTHPAATAEVVAALGWSVSDEDELVEFLQRTVDLATSVVGGATSAGVTARVGRTPFTAVATDDGTLTVDAAQYDAGDGPCLHAMRSGEVVHVDLATVRERWPTFAPDAEAAGISAFLAAPLGSDDGCLGALNLYATDTDRFSEDDAVLLQLLSAHAERSVGDYARLRASQDLVAQLQEAMVSRAPIEQAKGILMAVHSVSAEDAFELLRTRSQHTNTKLAVLAREFVAEHSGTGPAAR
ncbi:ANTAR domain-containing protein [Rhodococcus aerolatus]